MAVTLSLRLMNEPYTALGSVSSSISSQWVQLVVPAVVIPQGAGDGAAIDVGFMINTGETWMLPSSCWSSFHEDHTHFLPAT